MISSEKEVLENKDFYQSILDGIINGVWVTNADDIIFYANKGMENIAGIPANQIVGAHVLKDFPESALKYFRPYYLKAKETLKSVGYENIYIKIKGELIKNNLFEITDSETIVKKIIEPSLELYRKH